MHFWCKQQSETECYIFVDKQNFNRKSFIQQYQKPKIEKGQTTQWPKINEQNDKQRSTKHTHKAKYRVTRNHIKKWG